MALKVGQIGAGGIARPHLAAYVRHPHVREVMLADPDEAARERLTREFGIIKAATADYRDLLADDSIALVDICTPHDLHAPLAIEAMRAGKDVIVEKPLAVTVSQCDEMIQVAQETGRRLFCALCQRKFPAHIRARQLLEAGEIGRPFLASITVLGDELARMDDPQSWKGDWAQAGGGALFDTGYHAVYMLQHFFGPARSVIAMTRRLVAKPENKADDTSVVVLELESGVLGSIIVTYAATGDRWGEERRFVGTGGSLLVRDDPEDEMPLVVFHGADFQPIRIPNPPGVNQYAVRETVSYFVDCLLRGEESEITLQEARQAVATVVAAYQSEREGRRVEVEAGQVPATAAAQRP